MLTSLYPHVAFPLRKCAPYRRFFGLEKEFSCAADSEAVIRGFRGPSNLDRIFMNHVFVRVGIPDLICDIPAKRFKERIDKFPANLGFVVRLAAICVEVAIEPGNQLNDGLRRCCCYGIRSSVLRWTSRS